MCMYDRVNCLYRRKKRRKTKEPKKSFWRLVKKGDHTLHILHTLYADLLYFITLTIPIGF